MYEPPSFRVDNGGIGGGLRAPRFGPLEARGKGDHHQAIATQGGEFGK
jgi:hypothetical protein